MKVVFTKEHSDDSGTYTAGQVCDLPIEQAQQLIKDGVAKMRPPAEPTEQKRGRQPEADDTPDKPDEE